MIKFSLWRNNIKFFCDEIRLNFNQPLKNDPNAGLSFEEMCRREEQKLQEQRFREHQRRTGPKPVSFDGDYYSNVNYDSDVDSGLTFKVSIVSNMEIPK